MAYNFALSIYNFYTWKIRLSGCKIQPACPTSITFTTVTLFCFCFFTSQKIVRKDFSDEQTTMSSVTHTCSPHNIPQMHLSSSYTWSSFYSLFHHRRLRWWMPFYLTAFFSLFTVFPDFTLMCEFHCCSWSCNVKVYCKPTKLWDTVQYMVLVTIWRKKTVFPVCREKLLNAAMAQSKLERQCWDKTPSVCWWGAVREKLSLWRNAIFERSLWIQLSM